MANFRIDHGGMAELLKDGGIHAMIAGMTADVASEAEADFPDGFLILDGVVVTDRPQGNVTVVNRSAEAIEGKYGYLAKAAAAAGFEDYVKR